MAFVVHNLGFCSSVGVPNWIVMGNAFFIAHRFMAMGAIALLFFDLLGRVANTFQSLKFLS